MTIIIISSFVNFLVFLYGILFYSDFKADQKLLYFIFILNIFLGIYLSFVPGGVWGNCCNPNQLAEGGMLYFFTTLILSSLVLFYRGIKNIKNLQILNLKKQLSILLQFYRF